MARRRIIDPEFFLDEDIAKLSSHARLLYIGSWTLADDNVFTLPYRPEWIKAQLFPYEKINIEDLIKELIEKDKFIIFEYEGKQYIYIKNMNKHQRIDKPSKQKYPAYSGSPTNLLQEESGRAHSKDKLNKDNINKEKYGEYVFLSKDEFNKLNMDFGVKLIETYISRLNDYIGSKGKHYKSHYHTIRMWISRNEENKPKTRIVS
jgi:hypothetical protein